MVQVDVFWSFGLGAGFAMASARQLRLRNELRGGRRAPELNELNAAGEPAAWNGGAGQLAAAASGRDVAPAKTTGWSDFADLLQNRYMLQNILYVALLFAPSGIYLLWGFPNWETMQAGGYSMPAWLIVGFAITNVTQAILGFWVVERLVVGGRQYFGVVATWAGYFGMFFLLVNGWDKTGWHRFFSEDKADFARWSTQAPLDQVIDWLSSEVALTLYGMGVILIPVMAAIMVNSITTGYAIGGNYAPNRKTPSVVALIALAAVGVLSGVPTAIVCHLLITSIGWIFGSLVSAVLIWLLLLHPRFGLLSHGYRLLALEDAAYERLGNKGGASS